MSSATSSMSTMRSRCGRLAEQRREQGGLARAAGAGDEQVAAARRPPRAALPPAPSSNMPARASAASGNPAARGTRTEMSVPADETGGSTACTRMPRPSRTSTAGVASSMCRPPRAMSRTASARTSSSSADQAGSCSAPAPRSIQSPSVAVDEQVGDRPGCRERRERPEQRRGLERRPIGCRPATTPTRCTLRRRTVARRPPVGPGRRRRRPPGTGSSRRRQRGEQHREAPRRGAAAGVTPGEFDPRSHDGVATKGMVMRRRVGEQRRARGIRQVAAIGKSLPHTVVEEDSTRLRSPEQRR